MLTAVASVDPQIGQHVVAAAGRKCGRCRLRRPAAAVIRRPRFHSLRARLTVLYAGLFSAGLLALAILAQGMIERSARQTAADALAASGSVYDRLWQERERSLVGAADIPGARFRFPFGRGQRRCRDDRLRAGQPARAGRRALCRADRHEWARHRDAGPVSGRLAALQGDALGDRRDAVVAVGRRASRIVTAPVLAPLEIGRIVLIVPLDAQEMRGLERLSSIPLTASILIRQGRAGWTATGRSRRPRRANRVFTLSSAGEQSFAMLKPLHGMGARTEAALLLRLSDGPGDGAVPLDPDRPCRGRTGLADADRHRFRQAGQEYRPARHRARSRRPPTGRGRTDRGRGGDGGRDRTIVGLQPHVAGIVERGGADRASRLPRRPDQPAQPRLLPPVARSEIARAARNGEALALLYMDLDGFKVVNDALGHPVGDGLLRAVGQRLLELSDNAFVARLGGDEFVIIIGEAADHSTSRRLAHSILDVFANPVMVDGREVTAGISIGISLLPGGRQDRRGAGANADLAL